MNTNYKQTLLINPSPVELGQRELDILTVEFHLDMGFDAADLIDERVLDKPFDSNELFDILLEINRRKQVLL